MGVADSLDHYTSLLNRRHIRRCHQRMGVDVETLEPGDGKSAKYTQAEIINGYVGGW